jgi:hypothetical protein
MFSRDEPRFGKECDDCHSGKARTRRRGGAAAHTGSVVAAAASSLETTGSFVSAAEEAAMGDGYPPGIGCTVQGAGCRSEDEDDDEDEHEVKTAEEVAMQPTEERMREGTQEYFAGVATEDDSAPGSCEHEGYDDEDGLGADTSEEEGEDREVEEEGEEGANHDVEEGTMGGDSDEDGDDEDDSLSAEGVTGDATATAAPAAVQRRSAPSPFTSGLSLPARAASSAAAAGRRKPTRRARGAPAAGPARLSAASLRAAKNLWGIDNPPADAECFLVAPTKAATLAAAACVLTLVDDGPGTPETPGLRVYTDDDTERDGVLTLIRHKLLKAAGRRVLQDVMEGKIKVRQIYGMNRTGNRPEDSPLPKASAFYSEDVKIYKPYPNLTYMAEPEIPESVRDAMFVAQAVVGDKLGSQVGDRVVWNSVQLNVYRGQRSHIGAHSDISQVATDAVFTMTEGLGKPLTISEKEAGTAGGRDREGKKSLRLFLNGGDAYLMANHTQGRRRLQHSRPDGGRRGGSGGGGGGGPARSDDGDEVSLSLVFRVLHSQPHGHGSFEPLLSEAGLVTQGFISPLMTVSEWPTPVKKDAVAGEYPEDEPGKSFWLSREHLMATCRHHLKVQAVARALPKAGESPHRPAVSVVLSMPGLGKEEENGGVGCPNGLHISEDDNGVPVARLSVQVTRVADFVSLAGTSMSMSVVIPSPGDSEAAAAAPHGARLYINSALASRSGFPQLFTQENLRHAVRENGQYIYAGMWRAGGLHAQVVEGGFTGGVLTLNPKS